MPEGFTRLSETVCLDHIVDGALANLVRGDVLYSTCSFCEREAEESEPPFAVSMDVLGRHVLAAATWLYHDGYDEFFHEGYQAQYDTDEVITDVTEGAIDPSVWNEVVSHIADAITTPESWVSSQLHEDFLFSWESFANTVKYESRFVYVGQRERPGRRNEPPARLSRFLDGLNGYVQEDMFSELVPGDTLYRARMIESEDFVGKVESDPAKHLGPAPAGKASAGRLNPEGVGLFYGATNAKLAARETALHSRYDEALVGGFKVQRQLVILDFTKRPNLPSIFDESRRREFIFARFADDFVERLTQSVRLTGEERVEYVVTQVIGEYFRWAPIKPLDGIAWESHLLGEGERGMNVLVWANADDVRSDPPPADDSPESGLWRRSFGPLTPTLTLSTKDVTRHRADRRVDVQLVGLLGDVDDPDPMSMDV